MRIQLEPIWPWSELGSILADSSWPLRFVLVLLAVLSFVLPLGIRYLPAGWKRWTLSGMICLFIVFFFWMARGSNETDLSSIQSPLIQVISHLLLFLPLMLLGAMLRSYLDSVHLNRYRLCTLLALRFGTILCVLAAILRPHLTFLSPIRGTTGVIKLVVDHSKSMTIQDESGQPRWDVLVRTLKDCDSIIHQLRSEMGLEVEFHRFGKETAVWDPAQPGQATDTRTEIGTALDDLLKGQDRRPVRGIYLFSDGRNNGKGQITPLAAARAWRRKTRLHTVLLGNPTTPYGLRDVTVARLTPSSSLIAARTTITLQAQIDAPGFEGSLARIRVFVKGSQDAMPIERTANARIEFLDHVNNDPSYQDSQGKPVLLKETRNNEVRIRLPAPEERGDYTISVRVEDPLHPGQPLVGEINSTNNEASTLINVIPGGIRVLLIDRPRAWEPQMIFDVLKSDPRINARIIWLGGNRQVEQDLFEFATQKYDVIILGDVSARQLETVQPNSIKEIANLVNQGSGLIMLGGYASFGNEDWKGTALDVLLPVDLNLSKGLIERPVRMLPTDQGRRLLSLANGDVASEEKAWKQLPSLEQGIWKLVARGGQLDNILASSLTGDPILVSQNLGKGRVLAFAVDTTYQWRDTPEGVLYHARFWRQIVAWLAHLDNNSGNIWARPDQRDLSLGTSQGFQVGARGKGGTDIAEGVYEVEIETPGKKSFRVTTTLQNGQQRGLFQPQEPGEYLIRVKGKAPDPEGGEITGTGEARFLVNEVDEEMTEWSADRSLMEKLAKEGRGRAVGISQFPELLRELLASSPEDGKTHGIPWPNWQAQERSSFLPLFYLVFVLFLTTEWYFRRLWGVI